MKFKHDGGQPLEKKKSSNGTVRPVRGIQAKLVLAFMLPIACIILLGVVSYTKASNEIIQNYEESIVQTLDMTGQYYAFTLRTVETAIDEFYSNPDLQDYYSGLFNLSETKKTQFYNSTLQSLKDKAWSDDYIESIYILSGEETSMITNNVKYNLSTNIKDDNLYSLFMDTTEGQIAKEDSGRYYWFGGQAEFDEILNAKSDGYFIRMVRKFKNSDACMIVDISRKKLYEILSSLDLGEDSYLGLITFDGEEMLAEPIIAGATTERSSEESSGEEAFKFFDQIFFKEAVQGEDTSGFKYVDYNDQSYLFIFSKVGKTGAVICSLVPKSMIIGQASEIKNITIIIVILACLLAIVICSIIAGGIGKIIKYMTTQLKRATQGDLTVEFNTKRRDEFWLLSQNLNDMISNMKALVGKVKDTGLALASEASHVSDSSKNFVVMAKDIKSAINDIESGFIQLDESSVDCLKQMEMLSGRIACVNENTSQICSITESTSQAINEGIKTMSDLNNTTKSTTEITEYIINTIELLEQKTKSIGQIVDFINAMAKQTNLLSLNASIESARAGEAGRGFAVVAEEIRKLAEQSMQSAKQIQNIIEEISEYTNISVKATSEAKTIVHLQEKAVLNSSSSFNTMLSQIETLMKESNSIIESVQNMEHARITTSDAIESISAVSEETTARSATVGDTAEKQLEVVIQLDSASANLLNRAKDLETAINQFKVS